MQRDGASTLQLVKPPAGALGPDGRLAELVAHLTGCTPLAAVDAVEHALPEAEHDDLSLDDRLGVVAQAILAVKKEQRTVDLREARVERRPA